MHLISEENKSKLTVARRTEDLKDTSQYVDCFEGCITKTGPIGDGSESTSCKAKGVVWGKIQDAAFAAGASKILIHYSELNVALATDKDGEIIRSVTYLCGVSFYK